ncbi:MAG: Phosphatidate cytidylyltransferase [Rhodanobacteraceae bacterium]|jgi:phosphatidate cytidylyltransferase|nr:MAG: Phosphatidate cytidylyltransferase [Rhodanobacteraceae bacterium]
MLKQRVVTAIILAPLIVALIFLTRTSVFATLLGLIFLLGMWEWTRMAGVRGRFQRGVLLFGYLVLFALFWHVCKSPWWWLPVLAGLVWWLLALAWLMHHRFGSEPTRGHAVLKLLAGAMVVVPAWCAVVVMHGDMAEPHTGHGRWWVLFFACIVVAADIGAFTAGRRWGSVKLAPAISPGKTREGVYGALVCSGVVGLIGGALLRVPVNRLPAIVALALLTVLFSITGDLFESLVKRHAGVKDSGALFPGHGGVFDRMDSIVAALPVFVLGKFLLGL